MPARQPAPREIQRFTRVPTWQARCTCTGASGSGDGATPGRGGGGDGQEEGRRAKEEDRRSQGAGRAGRRGPGRHGRQGVVQRLPGHQGLRQAVAELRGETPMGNSKKVKGGKKAIKDLTVKDAKAVVGGRKAGGSPPGAYLTVK